MSIITTRDLCLWYGNSQALKNINIEIPERPAVGNPPFSRRSTA